MADANHLSTRTEKLHLIRQISLDETYDESHFMSQIRFFARLFNMSCTNSFCGPSTQTMMVPLTSAVVNFPNLSFQARLDIALEWPSNVWFFVSCAWPATPRVRASPAERTKERNERLEIRRREDHSYYRVFPASELSLDHRHNQQRRNHRQDSSHIWWPLFRQA